MFEELNANNYPVIKQSMNLYERAKNLIPSQTQTLAKGPQQHVFGVAPIFLAKGKGSRVWDVDGNEYIDLNMGIGPLSLGYSYPAVDEAIKKQLEDGITFSMPHPLEVEVAELIRQIIPNAEMVKYSKTGADVVSAAVRVARAYTKRNKVLCCGYHGWHDWYIATTDRDAGIPEEIKNLTWTINYNDINSVINSLDEDVACVVLEPTVFEEPKNNFLQELKEACHKNGSLLIFDEMWTGFRIALGGAQEFYKVDADLACFSKAVANGMPISILTGRKEIMKLFEKEVFFYTTFGGEALSLAAAKATILEMIQNDVISDLKQKGRLLKDGANAIADKLGLSNNIKCFGYDSRSMIAFSFPEQNPLLVKSYVQQELIRKRILWNGFHNISYSHTIEEIHYILEAYEEIFYLLKDAIEKNQLKYRILGEPIGPVFRKVGNFNTKPAIKN
jgi:glutamate-1-semialdehyde aminotransferase